MTKFPLRTLSENPFTARSMATVRKKRLFERLQYRSTTQMHRPLAESNDYHFYHNGRTMSSPTIHTPRRSDQHSAKHSQESRQRAAHSPTPPVSPAATEAGIQLSMHATMRTGERVHHVDLSQVRAALAVANRWYCGVPSAIDADRSVPDRGQADEVSDAQLFAFLLTLRPSAVERWSSTLLGLVERYQQWPAPDFNIVNRNLNIRVVIKNRVVVTVVPLTRKRRSA